jgi:hypothetical protein
MEKLSLIWQKLQREWKTFVLSLTLTITGAWELAVSWGADLPSLLSWVPEEYKSATLFFVGLAFLLLRKYTPTTVISPAKE